jgi:hypothetical protein
MASSAPRVLKYDFSRVRTFMLSSINGRGHLEDLGDDSEGEKKHTVDPDGDPDECYACWADAVWTCVTCAPSAPMCDICVRTLRAHDGHRIEHKNGGRYRSAAGMACSACRLAPLTRPYYQCMTCKDYYHCEACEAINDETAWMHGELMVHDVTHPMVKHRQAPPVTAQSPVV